MVRYPVFPLYIPIPDKLYMLTWNPAINAYFSPKEVNVLTANMGMKGLNMMMPGNKDMPIFYHPTDGRIRELNYGGVLSPSCNFFGTYNSADPTIVPCNIQYLNQDVNVLPRGGK